MEDPWSCYLFLYYYSFIGLSKTNKQLCDGDVDLLMISLPLWQPNTKVGIRERKVAMSVDILLVKK